MTYTWRTWHEAPKCLAWCKHIQMAPFFIPASLLWWPSWVLTPSNGSPLGYWMPMAPHSSGTPEFWHTWLCQSFQAHTQLALHAMHLVARCGPARVSCNASHLQIQKQMVKTSWALSLAACGGSGTSCMEPMKSNTMDQNGNSATHEIHHNGSISPGSWSCQLASSMAFPGKPKMPQTLVNGCIQNKWNAFIAFMVAFITWGLAACRCMQWSHTSKLGQKNETTNPAQHPGLAGLHGLHGLHLLGLGHLKVFA